MARKSRTPLTNQPEPIPVWHAHIGRDQKGKLLFLSAPAPAGSSLQEVAVVDIGRPFRIHVPSSPGHGIYGLLIDGMTGSNAEAWSLSQVLAAARFGMFGFRIIDQPATKETIHRETSNGQR